MGGRALSPNAIGSIVPPFGGGSGPLILAGDVTGPIGANTVVRIQGNPVSAAAPGVGDVFQWDGAAWVPTPAGGLGVTLDDVINAAVPDNDVIVPATDPIVFRDGAIAGFDLFTLVRTAVGADRGLFVTMGGATGGEAIEVLSAGSGIGVYVNNTGTGSAVLIQDAGANVLDITPVGRVVVTPSIGEDFAVDTTGAGAISLDSAAASNFTVAGLANDLTFGARAATITLNQVAPDDVLNGGFVATSIVGALNELFAGLGGVTLQDAYDASAGVPQITLTAPFGPFTLRDAAAPIGDVFVLEDNAGVNFFDVDPLSLTFGAATQRLFNAQNAIAAYGGVEFYPDAFTRTVFGTINSAFVWTSTLTSSIPGGGGIGNDGAPNFVNWAGECILTEQGNLFNTQSLFSQATVITCDGANSGPIYTMINQPLFRTSAAGGARSASQQNAVRSQMRVGPNLAGSFTVTLHEAYYATMILDATVGAVSVTTANYFAPQAPTLTAGATVGALNLINFPAIPAAGITTLIGLNSAMAAGTFINHTGTAPSNFAGILRMNNGIALTLGTAGGNRVQLLRSAAGVLRMIGIGGANNEGLDWAFDFAANVINVTSSTGAALRISNLFDINNGIALGGGAGATLGTIGGAGPVAAAQATWVRIDVGGVATWIPGWR